MSEPLSSKKDGPASRQVLAGREILDNNGINLLMAAMSSALGMAVAGLVRQSQQL